MDLKTVYNAPWFIKVVFVVSLFLVLFIAGLGYKHITSVAKSQEIVAQNYTVKVKLEEIFSYLKDAETGQRAYIVTQDSLYLAPLLSSRNKIKNIFTELKILTEDSVEQKKNIREFNDLVYNRIGSLEAAEINGGFENNIERSKIKEAFEESKAYMKALREKLSIVTALEDKLLNESLKEHKSNIKFTPFFLFSLIVFTLLLMFIAYVKINNDLEKLKVSNQQLQVFKESTKQAEIINKHGSWRWNVESNTFHFSDNLFRLLGQEPNSFEHTIANFMKFVHPEDVEKLSAQVDKMKHDKNLPFIFYRVIHNNGEIKYLKAYGKSIVNYEGEIQLLGTTTDITDEIDHFNTLEDRNKELELNNKDLQAFNYVASHDLQEPLRKIQTFLSRLEDSEADVFSDKGKLYMERINIAATRMRNLINDLLQYSRTNKSDEVKVMSSVNSLIEAVQQDLSEFIVSDDVEITIDTIPDIEVIPFQIEQLFLNLINNSLKYRHKEKKLLINISYNKVKKKEHSILKGSLYNKFHKITFKDNGIGFNQEYAAKIFELFSRLHTKEDYSGTGIGLSICKKIVDNHNGYILANGVPDKGATFIIYFPIS